MPLPLKMNCTFSPVPLSAVGLERATSAAGPYWVAATMCPKRFATSGALGSPCSESIAAAPNTRRLLLYASIPSLISSSAPRVRPGVELSVSIWRINPVLGSAAKLARSASRARRMRVRSPVLPSTPITYSPSLSFTPCDPNPVYFCPTTSSAFVPSWVVPPTAGPMMAPIVALDATPSHGLMFNPAEATAWLLWYCVVPSTTASLAASTPSAPTVRATPFVPLVPRSAATRDMASSTGARPILWRMELMMPFLDMPSAVDPIASAALPASLPEPKYISAKADAPPTSCPRVSASRATCSISAPLARAKSPPLAFISACIIGDLISSASGVSRMFASAPSIASCAVNGTSTAAAAAVPNKCCPAAAPATVPAPGNASVPSAPPPRAPTMRPPVAASGPAIIDRPVELSAVRTGAARKSSQALLVSCASVRSVLLGSALALATCCR